jgi:hypothetical protein
LALADTNGDVSIISNELPPFSNSHMLQLEPLAMCDYKWVKRGVKYVMKALVQLKNLSPEDATWEEMDSLRQQQFPRLDLQDKDRVEERRGGGGLMRTIGAGSLIQST